MKKVEMQAFCALKEELNMFLRDLTYDIDCVTHTYEINYIDIIYGHHPIDSYSVKKAISDYLFFNYDDDFFGVDPYVFVRLLMKDIIKYTYDNDINLLEEVSDDLIIKLLNYIPLCYSFKLIRKHNLLLS